MHLSRVLSPVNDVLTPSPLAERAPLFEVVGADAVDALRGGGAERENNNPVNLPAYMHNLGAHTCSFRGSLGVRPSGLLLLIYCCFPRTHDLFGKLGDLLCCMRAKFSYSEAGFAFLEQWGRDDVSAAAQGYAHTRRTLRTASVILASFFNTCRISTISWCQRSRKSANRNERRIKTRRDGHTPARMKLVAVILRNV
jgi:hypothetical protein